MRRDARTYVNALDQVESDGGALRMGTARSIQLGHDPRVRRRADRIIERRELREERQARRARRREAARLTVARGREYMAARDTLAENGGVLNGGLARAISHGRDPRVRRFVDRVDATLRDRRVARRRARERAAIRGQARTYVNALDRLQEDDVMNMGLALALDLGDDPRVKRVAERMQRREERAEQRERIRHKALRCPGRRRPGAFATTPGSAARSTGSASAGRCATRGDATRPCSTRSTSAEAR